VHLPAALDEHQAALRDLNDLSERTKDFPIPGLFLKMDPLAFGNHFFLFSFSSRFRIVCSSRMAFSIAALLAGWNFPNMIMKDMVSPAAG